MFLSRCSGISLYHILPTASTTVQAGDDTRRISLQGESNLAKQVQAAWL